MAAQLPIAAPRESPSSSPGVLESEFGSGAGRRGGGELFIAAGLWALCSGGVRSQQLQLQASDEAGEGGGVAVGRGGWPVGMDGNGRGLG